MNLKEVRKSLNLSQKEMGELLGITKDAVSKLERGVNKMSKPVELLLKHHSS